MNSINTMMAFLGFLIICSGTRMEAQTTKPNIILITLDDFNDWTPFLDGHQQAFTPNMNRLAERGTNFVNAFCNSPVCASSRTSFLSGKMPRYTTISNNEKYDLGIGPSKEFRNIFSADDNNETIFTIPEYLKDSAGYYTVGINKVFHGWANSGHDNDFDNVIADPCARSKSWSEFIEYTLNSDPIPSMLNGPYHDGVNGLASGPLDDSQEDEMIDTKGTNKSVEIINEYAANPGAYCDKPLFLALGIYRPHVPIFIPEKYYLPFYDTDIYALPFDKPYNDPQNAWPPNGVIMAPQPEVPYADFSALSRVGKQIGIGFKRHYDFVFWPSTLSPSPIIDPALSVNDRRHVASESRRALVTMSYLAAVSYIDAQIGKVMDVLDANPALAANTVVIITSDHGFSLGEKKHWLKNGLWDSDIRIPIIIFDPRREGGVVNKETVSLIDLFPTIVDLAEVQSPKFPNGSEYLDGLSMMPLVDNQHFHRSRPVITRLRLPANIEGSGCYPQFSVRSDRFHLIKYRGIDLSLDCDDPSAVIFDSDELYDVGRNREFDRNEWNNLADDPDYFLIKEWLERFLPGKTLDGTVQPVIKIDRSTLPCHLTRDMTLYLTMNLLGTENPEAYTSKWKISGYPVFFAGASVAIPMSAIEDSAWDARNDMIVQVVLVDSFERIVAIDIVNIVSGDSGFPNPEFTWAIEDTSRVAFTPLESTNFLETWEFGDGTILFEPKPAPHLFTRPGDYEVIHTISYGRFSENTCNIAYVDTVVLVDTNFGSACLAPNPAYIIDESPDQAWLKWEGVYNSVNYKRRHRQSGHDDLPWTETGGSGEEVILTDLEEFSPYEMQVKAFCPGGKKSDWSSPLSFSTGPCRPPLGLEYIISGDSLNISWIIRNKEVRGGDLFIYSNSVKIADKRIPNGVSSVSYTSFPPSDTFDVYVRSRCDQIGLRGGYKGKEFSI
ncbi:MAG: arylsulfatase A-like enzyme, partial [Limisphaerales bacterium]